MRHCYCQLLFAGCFLVANAQQPGLPADQLSQDFHKNRREALRKLLPANSLAIFFANPVRNRSNDVDYVYHQDPDFYYLTGYKEPHSVLLIFAETQQLGPYQLNELIFVRERDDFAELWSGKRLGVQGVETFLGFEKAYRGGDFTNLPIDLSGFDKVLFHPFMNDVRNTNHPDDLFDLIRIFKEKISLSSVAGTPVKDVSPKKQAHIDTESLRFFMASLREVKTAEELVLLKKAIEISAIGQLEMMKAMHPHMSEAEAQGVHEFIYKKYGAEYEGYPSIVGAGANGCILHYTNNHKPEIGDGNLILMDLGAEYRGYTADVTRTIPANGRFSEAQKLIYQLVYRAQEAGIAQATVGTPFYQPSLVTREIINAGLATLGIIATAESPHNYYPHGASHHIGLDVHDASNFGPFKEGMVITVEPGIYIPEGSDCDEKWWNIGVRIEDDILVTESGNVNLTAKVPSDPAEIEKLMA